MSNRYGTIIVSGGYGVRREAIIDGTPKPGTCMTVKSAVEPVNGRFTYEPYNRGGSGQRAEIAVLLEDELQGKLVTEAHTSGQHGMLYFPQPGDLLQMLVDNVTGTGDTFGIDDYMMIEDGTGKLIATSSAESEPFQIRETVSSALTSDTLVLCMYTGS